MWNGIRDFSDRHHVRPAVSLAEIPDGAKGVLVEIAYSPYTPAEMERLRQFAAAGNTLLLMDDFGHGNAVLEYLGLPARLNGGPLLDPLFCYKNPHLPRLTDFSPEVRELGVQAVALNHATVLDNVGPAAVLAWSSPQSFIDASGNGVLDASETSGPFPVVAEYPLEKGRVVIVADPSLIINSMAGQNDNNLFLHYLIEAGGVPENVWLDRSRLPDTPLDAGKVRLETARKWVSHPGILLFLVALTFAFVVRYNLKKEETIG